MLRGAIVGFGEVARHGHWPAYAASKEAQIVAVVDRTGERRDLARTLAPGIATFSTFDELSAAMSVDFVDICTPPALHPEPMLAAIDRGCHVLCEKPFLLDPAVIDIVRGRAAARGVAVVPVDNWKYAPIVMEATEILRQGTIGALRTVEIETVRIAAAPTVDADGRNWRRDPAIGGGGIVMDHGWHAVYLALHWFQDRPRAVQAAIHRPAGSPVEDEATMTLVFPAGQATITLTWNGRERRNTIRLSGTAGEILIDDSVLQVRGRETRSTPFAPGLSAGSHHADWFAAMLPAVIGCFREPLRACALVDEAAECLAVISQAYRSTLSLTAAPPH